jgi:predicted nucleic acid-binding protein
VEGFPREVSGVPLVFLDANVLFSACLGGASFGLLMRLGSDGKVRIVTSTTCEREARVNLERKHPEQESGLESVLDIVDVLDPALSEYGSWASALVHAGDIHVLAAARAVQADVLVTGDLRHFGHLMDRSDLALRVRTVRAFLEEGPS